MVNAWRREKAMRYSKDLRERVVEFARRGGSKRQAGRRFRVGEATVYRWLALGEHLAPKKCGPKAGHKLDWQKLRAYLEKKSDAQLREMAREFGVSHNAIWYACEKMKLGRKKNVDVHRGRAI